MNSPLMKSLVVIALRHVAPFAGGALASDDQLNQAAAALILLASIGYHVWQRHQGKKAIGEA